MKSKPVTPTDSDAERAGRLIAIAVVLWAVVFSLYLMLPGVPGR
jgi:cobalamin biosynthesis protein CobD/CbiB